MSKQDFRIAVIGAGPLGIAAGRELLAQGFNNFTIFEKERAAGGTWHMHSYPGLACDVWAHAYTFSYAPNPDWSASFVGHAEIEAYLQRCATDFGLDPYMQFNTRVLSAKFQADQWQVHTQTSAGETAVEAFDVVINAMGNQHTPVYPKLKGIDSFEGSSWHSTHWNHDIDLTGKRVVVVGSAAAAVQIVPEVAKVAKQLTVLQRSPNWILPRGRKVYSAFQRTLFNRIPALARLLRWGQGRLMLLMHKGAMNGSKQMDTFENMGRKYIAKAIKDPAIQKMVTPSSRFGCKRPLVADDFYPTLNLQHVRLLAEGASEVTPTGIVTSGGSHIDADIIIYCTGYRVLDYDRIEVLGKEQQNLAQLLEQKPEAYKGITVPGFPNYFFGMGPNAVVLSVSYFKSLEPNVACIVNLLAKMRAEGVASIDVKRDLHAQYGEWLQQNIPLFSWGSGGCNTYYQTDSGHHPFIFPGDYKTFLKQRAESGLHEYELT
ncbi:NAD(P)/FAD-dependent oxidoreductase [Oceanicoccus sp. KOV_DT_Chl]|uniref:flavin-containing monooxygenase n=1 Tax=Oceanicoccus sp. KOV_DT_Chl TaxID=1904639 RepID=UPI00135B399B|nr:NAD(P)/FAD-dependent oxidoreductase [Oceanicoccus sp. KOV_DT_Chl]